MRVNSDSTPWSTYESWSGLSNNIFSHFNGESCVLSYKEEKNLMIKALIRNNTKGLIKDY